MIVYMYVLYVCMYGRMYVCVFFEVVRHALAMFASFGLEERIVCMCKHT
jgi:hypothetical protein